MVIKGDGMTLSFFLPCVPPRTNHQRKQIVRRGRFHSLADRPELVAAKDSLDAMLLPHQPGTPVRGPYRLEIEWTWPWLAGHSKRVRALGRIRHISKPDLTNVAKTIEDRMAVLRFIEDDKQVVDLRLSKWWGESPGIQIAITSLEGQ